jgi:GDP-mannose 6-dehydrogenase
MDNILAQDSQTTTVESEVQRSSARPSIQSVQSKAEKAKGMRISVFGIGYVGAVSAACLAHDGNTVVTVDPNPDKVRSIKEKASPILEPGLDKYIEDGVDSGRLTATADAAAAIAQTDLSLVCVGTPSRPNGSLDTSYVVRVAETIGAALKAKSTFHVVVFRSTILPGTMEQTVIPALERASGMQAGVDFGVAYYPEFLRESTAIKDYYDPGTIVFGQFEDDVASMARLVALTSHLPVEPIVVPMRAAEAVKYANNAWHAVKISFANEIGNICKAASVDSYQVMDVLCADKRLNISPAYLKPGFAFGGSCLPKDLRALRHNARLLDVPTPMLDATLQANENQLAKAYSMITHSNSKRVGIIGLSFKTGTDDLRESPLVELAERLYGKGYNLRIYDPNVRYDALVGANLNFIKSYAPHLSGLMVDDFEDLVDHSEVIVVGKRDEDITGHLGRVNGGTQIIDLVRLDPGRRSAGGYQGICW